MFVFGREYVYCGLKCCVNWENKENNFSGEMFADIHSSSLSIELPFSHQYKTSIRNKHNSRPTTNIGTTLHILRLIFN
jgi:hypothetical protein